MKDKVHRGLMGNALVGKNTGGKAYAYYPVVVRSETELDTYESKQIRDIEPIITRAVEIIMSW